MCYRLIFSVTILVVGQSLLAQLSGGGTQYVSETLQLDPKLIDGLIQSGDAGGKEIRWVTLVEKTRKHGMTVKLAEAKRRERELQRTQLAELADGLRRTKELFEQYYEKYQIVSGAVQTISGFIKIGKRVKVIIETLDRLRVQFMRMNQFDDRERDIIGRTIMAMVERTNQVVKAADFVLTGSNVPNEKLDELREEHGSFVVTLRTIDRTEQLAAVDKEIALIINDLQQLVSLLSSIQNNRTDGTVSQAEYLRNLHKLSNE